MLEVAVHDCDIGRRRAEHALYRRTRKARRPIRKMRRTCGLCAAKSSTTWAVPSEELSSMKITSHAIP